MERLGLAHREYLLITLHSPSNVDDPVRLSLIADQLSRLGHFAAVFSRFTRARALAWRSRDASTELDASGVRCVQPLGYLDFLSLETAAGAILTDSGGIQEEASALGVCCYTFRRNTERPITVSRGTNVLLGDDPAAIARVRPSPASDPLRDSALGWSCGFADRERGRVRVRSRACRDGLTQQPCRPIPTRVDLPSSSRRCRPRPRPGGRPSWARRSTAWTCANPCGTVFEAIESGEYLQHVVVNVAKLIALQDDESLREIVHGCALINADGQGVVWASRLLGDPLPERVAGIDLMFNLLALADERLPCLRARCTRGGARAGGGATAHPLPAAPACGVSGRKFGESEVDAVARRSETQRRRSCSWR